MAKLLGHKDVTTTQRYAHHYPESLRDGVDILDTMRSYSADQEGAISRLLHDQESEG